MACKSPLFLTLTMITLIPPLVEEYPISILSTNGHAFTHTLTNSSFLINFFKYLCTYTNNFLLLLVLQYQIEAWDVHRLQLQAAFLCYLPGLLKQLLVDIQLESCWWDFFSTISVLLNQSVSSFLQRYSRPLSQALFVCLEVYMRYLTVQ